MKIVDYTFEVTVEAVEVLQSMRQMSGNENGGILLGIGTLNVNRSFF